MSTLDKKPYDPFTETTNITPAPLSQNSISTPSVNISSTDSSCPLAQEQPTVKITGATTTADTTTTTADTTTTAPDTTTTPSAPSADFTGASGSTDFSNIVKAVFNTTTITILFWVITAYIIYRLGNAIFSPKPLSAISSGQLTYSRTIDITLSIMFFLAFFGSYNNLPENEKNNITGYSIEWTYQFFNDPWSLLLLIWFTIIFFFLVYILRVPTAPDVKPVLVKFIEAHIWIFYALFGIIFFFKYVLNIQIVNILLNNSFTQYLENLPALGTPSPSSSDSSSVASPSSPSLWTDLSNDWDIALGDLSTPTPAPSPAPTPSSIPSSSPTPSSTPTSEKQVFNVSENKYTYKQAQKLCKAFDSNLASYDQIENAYNGGAEWCNYGWSAGQMAYFPTQKSTYNRLAQNPYTKNACGRPGINGGYMRNPNIRFGVNCYGVKPQEPANWTPPVISAPPAPKPCEIPVDPRMERLRKNAKIAGFNNDEWSRY